MARWIEFDKRTNRILTSKMSAELNQLNNTGSSYWFTTKRSYRDKRLKMKPTRVCVDKLKLNKLSLTLRKAEISKGVKLKMRKGRVEGFFTLEGEARKEEPFMTR